MKKLISLALIVSCIFTFGNCSQNEVDKIKPYFNFTEDTNTSPEFTADGGTTLVSFETSHNWTAYSNQNWITLSSKSGTPSNANFTITVSENKSTSLRDGVVEIKSNNNSYTIFVSQMGKEEEKEIIFTLSPSTSTIPAEGGNVSLTLKYDVDEDYIQYGVFDKNNNPIDWIELVDTRTNTLELIFNVSKNTSSSDRVGIIVLYDSKNDKKQQATITQKGAMVEEEIIFTLSPSTSTISAEGGDLSLTLKHDVDIDYIQYGIYDKNNNPIDWIELVETRTNTLKLIFSISKNTSSSERVGVIVLYDIKNNKEQKAVLTQRGVEAVFEFINNTDTSPEFNAQGGTSQVSFKTSHDWTASSNQNWISLSRMSGTSSNANFTISVGENTSTFQRTGVVTIISNSKSYKINVTQKGASEPIISFEDSITKSICMDNWDTNKDGEISYTEAEKVTKISANIFTGTSIVSFRELKYFKNIQEIHSNAFNGCYSLTSIELPDGVTSIGDYVFYNCTNLNSVVIPTCWIGNYMFANCKRLTNITIGNGVTLIGEGAFVGCEGLDEITIPDSVTSIGNYAFQNCSTISISIGNGVSEIGSRAFDGCNGTLAINSKVIETNCAINDYENPNYWLYNSTFSTITIGETISKIGNNVFRDFESIQSVHISDSVKIIGDGAFAGCKNLSSLNMGKSIVSIGISAFGWCASLKKIIIPNSVETIGSLAFIESPITKITIPSSVKSIGESAFCDCDNLDRVDISDLSAWCKIDFADKEANPLHYKDQWTQSPSGARLYLNNEEVTYLTIPSDITEIKDYAFIGCMSLSWVEIHEDVTYIGCSAFHNCTSISVVECYPKTPPTLGDSDVFTCSYRFIDHIYEIWVKTNSREDYIKEWNKYKSVICGYL